MHTFHIPVMGLAYTIDSPIKVARFGISSVISIVEDRLVEMMRKHYYPSIHREYTPISIHETDYREKRITDYLNLVNTIVQAQVEKLRKAAFEKGSEIVKYFEMLPEDAVVKQLYRKMLQATNTTEQQDLQAILRTKIKPGAIDVNIMTKTVDPITALKGYANSDLTDSSVVFSAGMDPRLYNYLEGCTQFDADAAGIFRKKIIVKVSDYRSALIQGKYLAKKGIWVSEFRIESGLNCGGHAFATDGYLLGPILEEFKNNKPDLITSLFELYKAAILRKSGREIAVAPPLRYSVQGGIGTCEEDTFLRHQYDMDSTGWGTPFLLVPEATTVDETTLQQLCAATEKEVVLSNSSPLGARFHYLKGTSAENERLARVAKGKPGSPCTEKHLTFNTEFTAEPICTASVKYQQLKIAQLKSLGLPEEAYKRQLENVLEKECLCVGLSNAAAILYDQPFVKTMHTVTVCPGPNIVHFSKVVSLQTMTDHIYGRTNILPYDNRPHVFIAELRLYVAYLKEQLELDFLTGQLSKRMKYFTAFFQNLQDGIRYYQQQADIITTAKDKLLAQLQQALTTLEAMHTQYLEEPVPCQQ
ncbi:hypothetical protein CLV59_105333 [Chitinophaga dinghuensis]|uniref:Uncharacterized protein n=1 Tax=Chitinophaga dinghuensis TaxID=1539050 RepID=A0A327VZ89_9BACT|nr:hypothetical protein [Chitinophaga dinghuensis]RAJ80225.1 hypothetical protein CLV59_105333 [Chitinophaga dinghuensis]